MSESLEKASDKALEARIKASLEQSAKFLDDDTQSRLQAIRRAALNQPTNKHWFHLKAWVPAASLVFCSVIAVLIILPPKEAPSSLLDQTAMLELLDNPDELDVISDPDFYLWVDEIGFENGA